MDELLKLDPEVLRTIATVIEKFIEVENGLMVDYYQMITKVQEEWDDPETIGQVLEKIEQLIIKMNSISEEIINIYPRFFREKADFIDSRREIIGKI